ncbi:hypothetical protein MYCTH_97974 [Thermothelomyces thermophilus ATCC 42464]|uniref:Uncharacterized protein n=1 Tax=Thermothelomyces thermophilus (strain ATCC 42464 / BCRC 31852 / DSM 1799) TaxID=573729 RepID=G2QLZ2_THET4|nr:uncharacterized protein MYCTH_97974 [Thermothelomyces thermophilus ATCC 42464]AEO60972.1 hypothetical protein MYCTH_97974 [Thermothelomyces thermophilus ATCC 42464]
MAPNHDQRYDPVPPIPTYEEAIASGSAWHRDVAESPVDHARHTTEAEAEGQSLLTNSRHAFESTTPNQPPAHGRRPRGYRPPTVETDDESSLFSSSSDSDSDDEREADQVRREMQELEIDDSDVHGRNQSSWGKRIGLSLPPWRWKWRWRLPTLRRPAAAGGSGNGNGSGSGSDDTGRAPEAEQTSGSSWFARARPLSFPKFGSTALFLLVGRTLAILIVMGFLYLLFASDLWSDMARRMGSQMFDPESIRIYVQSNVDPRKIREHLQHFTSYAHLAGTAGDFALMEDTEMLFTKYGLEDVKRDVYQVYLNYPTAQGRAVEIWEEGGKMVWAAKLEEEEVGGRSAGRQTFAFHGHSRSGDVQGRLIYANYGSKEDFQALSDRGINTTGTIVLVRHYGPQEDLAFKVKAAEEAGAAGCITFTDPSDNGFVKGTEAPKGRFMPADGVQRGSVSLTNWVVGDPLTPSWESKENMPRMKVDQTQGLAKIPSIPLAWRDAQGLLQRLQGCGHLVPKPWVGGVPDVGEWWTGNGSSPIVRLRNEQDEVERQPIWNVYGRIVGIEQGEKKVIVGNHRDSWAFGAADPHSGTAIMMEIIRVLGDVVARGWRPLRTIEFASWDGSEYNLIGSTEYVEHNEEALRRDALAYINLGKAVSGRTFRAAGSPVFRKLLLQVLNRVGDPHYNATLRERWDERKGKIEGLGVDSDYVAFQDIVGTSSLDLHFDGDRFPHHSSYENFEWMDNVGDPGFIYHTLLGQVLGLLILELADRPVMPFDMPAYADNLLRWVNGLKSWAEKQPGAADKQISFWALELAAKDVAKSVGEFVKWESSWETRVLSASGWEPSNLGRERCDYNARMAQFESDLLDLAGMPHRTQFKHVVFGPQVWPGDPEAYFPSIRDAIKSGNATLAQLTVDRVAGILKQAGDNLLK